MSATKQGHLHYTSCLILFALLLFTNAFQSYWHAAMDHGKMDYFTFWSFSHSHNLNNITNPYEINSQQLLAQDMLSQADLPDTTKDQKDITSFVVNFYDGRIDTTSSPFLYASISSLHHGTFSSDVLFYDVFSSFCLISSLIILCRISQFNTPALLMFITLIISTFEPLLSELRVGNCNEIQLFLITSFILLLLRSRRTTHLLAPGIILGLAIMFKPNIGLIFILLTINFMVNRKYYSGLYFITGTALGAGLGITYSIMYFGRADLWVKFLVNLGALANRSYPLSDGNIGLSYILNSLLGYNFSLLLLILPITIFTFMTYFTRLPMSTNPSKETSFSQPAIYVDEILPIVGLSCAIMIISAPFAWIHYYLLLIPIISYVLRPRITERDHILRQRFLQASGAMTLFLLSSVSNNIFDLSPLSRAIQMNIGALLITGCAFYEFWNYRKNILSEQSREPAILAREGA